MHGVALFLAKTLLKKRILSGGPALTFEKHPKIASQLSGESLIVFFRTRRVPGDLMFRLLIVFSNVIVDITISCRSFVFCLQSVDGLRHRRNLTSVRLSLQF